MHATANDMSTLLYVWRFASVDQFSEGRSIHGTLNHGIRMRYDFFLHGSTSYDAQGIRLLQSGRLPLQNFFSSLSPNLFFFIFRFLSIFFILHGYALFTPHLYVTCRDVVHHNHWRSRTLFSLLFKSNVYRCTIIPKSNRANGLLALGAKAKRFPIIRNSV